MWPRPPQLQLQNNNIILELQPTSTALEVCRRKNVLVCLCPADAQARQNSLVTAANEAAMRAAVASGDTTTTIDGDDDAEDDDEPAGLTPLIN